MNEQSVEEQEYNCESCGEMTIENLCHKCSESLSQGSK